MTEAEGDEVNTGPPTPGGFLDRYGELMLYLAAGVAYITIGVFVKQLLALWLEGAAFLLLTVWLIPAAIRRLF